jgi:hypothetical protein
MVLGIGHPDAVTKYVAWLFDNPTYLYEHFDLATPQTFLYDFVRHGDQDRCVAFLPWNRLLVKEFPGGYVEYSPVQKGMHAVVKTWYLQCEQVCSLLLRASFVLESNQPDRPFVQTTTTTRLDTPTIVAALRALHFQFQTLVDLENVRDFMQRMCFRHRTASSSSNPGSLNLHPVQHHHQFHHGGTRTPSTPNQPATPPPESASDGLCPVSPQRQT